VQGTQAPSVGRTETRRDLWTDADYAQRPVLSRSRARELVGALTAGGLDAAAVLPSVLDDYRVTRGILDGSSAGICVVDPGLRYVYVNDALAAMNGLPAVEHLGRRVPEVLPDLEFTPLKQVLLSVLREGRPQVATMSARAPSDPTGEPRCWVSAYHRLDDGAGTVIGVVAVVLEVTETYRVGQLLDAARNRLALLDDAATRIGTTLDVEHTCKELTRLLVPRFADVAAVDVPDADGAQAVLPARGPLRLRRVALSATGPMSLVSKVCGVVGTAYEPQLSSSMAQCLTQQRPVIADLRSDSGMASLASTQEVIALGRELGLHSAMFVPLTARRNPVGVLALVRAGGSPPFSEEDLDLVCDLARRAATSIHHARRYTHEHQTARVLQQALLAKPRPPHSDLQCASRYLPTGADIEIGGDWYDTVALPGGKTLLVVGDVMGHGSEAAAAMSEYRTMLRTLALRNDEPDVLLNEAQRTAEGLDFDRVATCLAAVVDPGAHSCVLANAGHMPPLLISADGSRGLIEVPVGPPLGVGALPAGRERYRPISVAFEPGATLLLYTDGLVERRDRDIEDCLGELARLDVDPRRPLEQLLDAVLNRFRAQDSEDDVAVLAARLRHGATEGPRKPESAPELESESESGSPEQASPMSP
jgi:PAS domain S-box-containing protein